MSNVRHISGPQTAPVRTADILADQITASLIAASAVGSSELADDAVDTASIAALQVTAAKLAAAVTGMFRETMVACLVTTGTAFNANSTVYAVALGHLANNSTEANAQAYWHDHTGTFQDAAVYVSANGLSNAGAFTFRDDGADTSIVISVTAATTGWFTDLSNTATVAAGSLVGWKWVAPAGGTSATCRVLQIDVVRS